MKLAIYGLIALLLWQGVRDRERVARGGEILRNLHFEGATE